MSHLLSAITVIDELLKYFDKDEIESKQTKYGTVTSKIDNILNIDIRKNSNIESLSQSILSIIEDIVKTDSYSNCDSLTPCFIIKLFKYYHQIIMDIPSKLSMINPNDIEYKNNNNNNDINKEQQSKNNKIRWKILMVITESFISYFYKYNIITNEIIWTDIIHNILLCKKNRENTHYDNNKINNDNNKNSITIKRKILILLQLITGCGESLIKQNINNKSILIETKLFFKKYIINYVPTPKYATQELLNMKRISLILELINNKIFENKNDNDNNNNININVINIKKESVKKKKKKRKPKPKKKKGEKKIKNKCEEKVKETEDEQILTSQIERYYLSSLLTEEEKQKRNKLLSNISRIWKKVLFEWYPSLKSNYKSFDKHSYITVYGSVSNNLSNKLDSNIDIYLTIPSHLTMEQMDENEILKQLSKELNNETNNNFKSSDIYDCTSPSILVEDIKNNININISYDEHKDKTKITNLINLLCNHNDKRIDIKKLILTIKYWSKKRYINHNKTMHKSHLNSFGFVLLIFKYLQVNNILPILTKTRSTNGYHIKLEIDNNNNNNNNNNKNKKQKHIFSLSKLLYGFFEFYSKFDYEKYAISLFHKNIVEKKGGGKKGSYRDLNQRELGKSKLIFVIEYPLQTNYNCSKNVTQENAINIKLEFYRANIILKYLNGDFHDLCKPAK